ncbi:MAG: hypothetical protein V4673_14315 [Pseudomonadota bacterium]
MAEHQTDDDIERCMACDAALIEGDDVYNEKEGGFIHAACCGPERESYFVRDGEPLSDSDEIPKSWKWTKLPGQVRP